MTKISFQFIALIIGLVIFQSCSRENEVEKSSNEINALRSKYNLKAISQTKDYKKGESLYFSSIKEADEFLNQLNNLPEVKIKGKIRNARARVAADNGSITLDGKDGISSSSYDDWGDDDDERPGAKTMVKHTWETTFNPTATVTWGSDYSNLSTTGYLTGQTAGFNYVQQAQVTYMENNTVYYNSIGTLTASVFVEGWGSIGTVPYQIYGSYNTVTGDFTINTKRGE